MMKSVLFELDWERRFANNIKRIGHVIRHKQNAISGIFAKAFLREIAMESVTAHTIFSMKKMKRR